MKLFDEIEEAIKARSDWEKKQDTFYQLRHNGLRRQSPPWPGAADLHDPISDTLIEKLKPNFVEQLYANELLAAFYSVKKALTEFTEQAAQWFDWKVKHQTNFLFYLVRALDSMLQGGKGLLRIYYDDALKKLCFQSIDPNYLIVPSTTDRLNDDDNYADWICHIEHYTFASFRRREEFDGISDEVAKSLLSYPKDEDNTSTKEHSKLKREGLNWSAKADTIIIWRVYRKTRKGIEVKTRCPANPEIELRAPFMLNYTHGRYPFVELNAEIKGIGYYDPRGVTEKVASEENSNSRMLNAMHDYITLVGRPIYSTGGQYINSANIKAVPGQIINANLTQVTQLPTAINYDQTINLARVRAEERAQVPNFAVSSDTSGGKARTATETDYIKTLQQQGNSMKSRIFAMDLGAVFWQAWHLLVQFEKDDLDYLFLEESHSLPPKALELDYWIVPNGSGDNFNKTFAMQKALAIYQELKDDPYANRSLLVKDILMRDNPATVRDRWVDPDIQTRQQTEDQGIENVIMEAGTPALVKETDNHSVHLMEGARYVVSKAKAQLPLSAGSAVLVLQHLGEHLEYLKKTNPEEYKKANVQIGPVMAYLHNLGQSAQPQPQVGMAA